MLVAQSRAYAYMFSPGTRYIQLGRLKMKWPLGVRRTERVIGNVRITVPVLRVPGNGDNYIRAHETAQAGVIIAGAHKDEPQPRLPPLPREADIRWEGAFTVPLAAVGEEAPLRDDP